MQWRICILSAVALSACAPQSRIAGPVSAPPATPPQLAAPLPEHGPLAINDYKRTVASRIVAANEEVFFEPLPEMLKSVVVLEITVDRHGFPVDVHVIRSNGYRELEQVALASVLQGAACVSFLETFLFRGDGFYQVLSLVLPLQDSFSPSLAGASN